MDPDLAKAAISGDVDYLKKTCQNNFNNLLSVYKPNLKSLGGNIFHLAAWNNQQKFFEEAMKSLSDTYIRQLLCSPETKGWNPLHAASKKGHVGIVKLIIEFYGRLTEVDNESKPWLSTDLSGSTPLHVGLQSKASEECALLMMSLDMEVLYTKVDNDGNSPLFLAVRNGCNQVALTILNSTLPYRLSGINGLTPLHFVMNCSDEVLRQLLEKHPEYITKIDYSVLRKWTEAGKLRPYEYILNSKNGITISWQTKSKLVNLIYETNNRGDNVFHVAAKKRKVEAATILSNIHRTNDIAKDLPWLVLNKKLETPLELVMMREYQKGCIEYREIDMKLVLKGKCELLFLALNKKLYQAAEGIWNIQHKYGWSLYPPQGWDLWHDALNNSDEVAIWLAKELPDMTSNHDDIVYTLKLASEVGASGFLEWMLKKNPSSLKKAPTAWVEACKKGNLSTVIAFIDNYPSFRQLCHEKKDTPLHHIKLEKREQYQEFLHNSVMSQLTNFQDSEGDTPLHKAIRTRNLLFAEVLLNTDDVTRRMKNNDANTAMDLLDHVYKDSWEWNDMCKRNGIVPWLKYFQDKSNMKEARNTLSVVAALLATITFTAGFTLPGGVKSDSTGKATLANKAAFFVFLLADAVAMCCSMLVLVWLMWSMISDHNRSLLLIDRSMPVLLIALYSTLLAFTTGVYVVIPHKSLWVAIVILIMCSITSIISNRHMLHSLLDKLNPDLDRTNSEGLEQGESSTNEAPPEVPQEVGLEMKPLNSRDQGETNEASTSGGNSLKNVTQRISIV